MACTLTTLYGTTQFPTITSLLATLTYTYTPDPTVSTSTVTCGALDILCVPSVTYITVPQAVTTTVEEQWTTVTTRITSVVPQKTLLIGEDCTSSAVETLVAASNPVKVSVAAEPSSSAGMTGVLTDQFSASSVNSGTTTPNVGVGQFGASTLQSSMTLASSASSSSTTNGRSNTITSSVSFTTSPAVPANSESFGATPQIASSVSSSLAFNYTSRLSSTTSKPDSASSGNDNKNSSTSTTTPDSSHSVNGGAIAGGILGVLVALISLTILGMWMQRRKEIKKKIDREKEDYWENRFRQLEAEVDGDDGGVASGVGIGLAGEVGDEKQHRERTETKRLHLTLDLASKEILSSRPNSRQSFISFFTRFRHGPPPEISTTPKLNFSSLPEKPDSSQPPLPNSSESETDSITPSTQSGILPKLSVQASTSLSNGARNSLFQYPVDYSRPRENEEKIDSEGYRHMKHPNHVMNNYGFGYSRPSSSIMVSSDQVESSFLPLQINKKKRRSVHRLSGNPLSPNNHGNSSALQSQTYIPLYDNGFRPLNFTQRFSAKWIPRTTTAGAPPSTPGYSHSGYSQRHSSSTTVRTEHEDGDDVLFEEIFPSYPMPEKHGRKGMEWIRSAVDDDALINRNVLGPRRNHHVHYVQPNLPEIDFDSSLTVDSRRGSNMTTSSMATYAPSGRLPLPPLPGAGGREKGAGVLGRRRRNSNNDDDSFYQSEIGPGQGSIDLPPHLRPTSPSTVSLSSSNDHAAVDGTGRPWSPRRQSKGSSASLKEVSFTPLPSSSVQSSMVVAGSTSNDRRRTLYPPQSINSNVNSIRLPKIGTSSDKSKDQDKGKGKEKSKERAVWRKKAPPQLQLSPSTMNPCLWVNEIQLALDIAEGDGKSSRRGSEKSQKSSSAGLPTESDLEADEGLRTEKGKGNLKETTDEMNQRKSHYRGNSGGSETEINAFQIPHFSANAAGDEAYGGIGGEGGCTSETGSKCGRRGSSPRSLGWISSESQERSAVTPRLAVESKVKGKARAID